MAEQEYHTGIEGMYCASCADTITNALLYTKGVIRADCSYWKNQLDAVYDPELTSEEAIRRKLEKIGYPAGEGKKSSIRTELLTAAMIIAVFFLLQNVRLPGIPAVDGGRSFIYLFIVGLTTGVHCVCMCGGFMLAGISPGSGKQKPDPAAKSSFFLPVLVYNLTRTGTGTALGAVFGAVGSILAYTDDLRRILFLFAGMMILWTGLNLWGIFPATRKIRAAFLPPGGHLPKNGRRLFGKPAFMGVLNAFMPCSSSQMIWLLAAASGSPAAGAALMFFFGLGTIPCMLLFGVIGRFQKGRTQTGMRRACIVMIMAMGLQMILRAF